MPMAMRSEQKGHARRQLARLDLALTDAEARLAAARDLPDKAAARRQRGEAEWMLVVARSLRWAWGCRAADLHKRAVGRQMRRRRRRQIQRAQRRLR